MQSEEGIWPAPMIARRPTKPRTFLPLTQECSQPTPHESVNIPERGPMGVLEVSKPTPENGIELCDDAFQTTATGAARQLPDLITKSHSAFRARPATACFESIAQKFKPLSFLRAIAHAGFIRMQYQTMVIHPVPDRDEHLFGLLSCAAHDHKVSQPREPPPQLLSEPSVNLSAHWAPIIQPLASHPASNAETCRDAFSQYPQACVPHVFCGTSAFCISSSPTNIVCD